MNWSAAVLLMTASAHSASRVESRDSLAIVHASVIDIRTGTIRADRTVLLSGARIAWVRPSGTLHLPQTVPVVNASGKYLMPGLWDAHVHLSYLSECALPVFVANGVTAVRDAGARLDEINPWRARIASGELVGPLIKAAGPNLESGEWLSRAYQIAALGDSLWYWGQRLRVDGPEAAPAIIDSLVSLGVDFVKFRNLPRESFLAIAAEARRRGLPIAGHAPKGIPIEAAAAVGLGSFEHAETVMLALAPFPRARRLSALREVARKGTFITPTLINGSALWLIPDSVALAIIADSAGYRDPWRKFVSPRTVKWWTGSLELNKKGNNPAADWHAIYDAQVADMRLARQAGVRFLAGTDIGSVPGHYPGVSLHDELAAMVRDVGLSPREALMSAISAPPMFFGLERERGAVAPGMAADLVLLDGNPLADIANTRRVRAVILRGRFIDRAGLDNLLDEVASQIRTRTGCALSR